MNPTNEENWTVVSENTKKEKVRTDRNKLFSTNNKAQISNDKITRMETMIIEPENMGFVVGRKGCHLKPLEDIYGVKFILPPKGGSRITIKGPAQMVSAAKKHIEDNLNCKTSFFIEKAYIGLVIGREGEKTRAMEDALHVRIRINIEGGEVIITGVRCEEAKKAIEDQLSCVTSFFIGKDYRRTVVGPEAATVGALEKKHSVKINTKRDGKVVVIGNSKQECESAKKAIEYLIEQEKSAEPYEEKFVVPANLVRFVCGFDGSTVDKIESTFGVHVFIPSSEDDNGGEIIVRGSTVAKVSVAKQHILENLLGATILELDEILVGRMIGSGGETVLRINKEYGVVVHFDQKNQDGKGRRNVSIFGDNKGRTKAAKDAIISIITGRGKS